MGIKGARRIRDYLRDRVATLDNPRQVGQSLKGQFPELWRYRIGGYLVPRSTLFCGSEPTKRAKTALQPLEIVHYSLRATPCLDAPSEL
uniref:Uncharacterized protein n=1 Tax=Candidatus Kentrum sp. DK TaxID=2126562 RepID=A0A450SLH2_9GAMM|nr:MAG: hypothetical protein BECKDK2373C_GA0170839_104324 [Candidatus Kentron sp. DK]